MDKNIEPLTEETKETVIETLKELITKQNKTFINANVNMLIALLNASVICSTEIYDKEVMLINSFKL